jgi:hypothetical protein
MPPAMALRRLSRYLRLGALFVLAGGVAAVVVWGFVDGNATLVTGATALIVLVVGEYRRWQIAAQQDRWGRIAGEYERFFELIRRQVQNNDGPPDGKRRGKRPANEAQLRSEEAEREMATFADKLMLWGSPRVIKAWVAMRRNAADGPPPVTSQMEDFGRMVLAIRREFGHSDRRLEERDLFRIIFNDEIEVLLARANLRDGREILRALRGEADTAQNRSVTALSNRLQIAPRQVEYVLTGFQDEKPPFVQKNPGPAESEDCWAVLPAGLSALEQLEQKNLDDE